MVRRKLTEEEIERWQRQARIRERFSRIDAGCCIRCGRALDGEWTKMCTACHKLEKDVYQRERESRCSQDSGRWKTYVQWERKGKM